MKQFISSCALMMALTPALAHANDVVGTEPTEVKTTEATATQQAESPSTMEQILARLPKICKPVGTIPTREKALLRFKPSVYVC